MHGYKKVMSIGIDFYKKVIGNNYYYDINPLLFRDLSEHRSAVALFTRPRRWEKPCQSMLRAFFEEEAVWKAGMGDMTLP